jgi:hypothetical protein
VAVEVQLLEEEQVVAVVENVQLAVENQVTTRTQKISLGLE